MKWGADGVVVGATVPQKIAEVKQILEGKVAIYSPGVGTQGGAAETALKAGVQLPYRWKRNNDGTGSSVMRQGGFAAFNKGDIGGLSSAFLFPKLFL